MDGLSHYLQSSTQGAMIVPTAQTSTRQTKLLTQQPHQDDEPPQYFSNSMSVLPADRYGSYYIVYHRGVSGNCIDAEAASNNNGNNRRDEYGVEQQRDDTSEQVRTAPKTDVKFAGTKIYERQRREPSPRAIRMQVQDDDEDEYDYYDDGCASHAAEACVASSIPVLHFIQFFMC
mmetsp:Transcript_7672/g.11113  ORF Transcript_7672/g.11113 Transcript_7672/m.11113 type:complete len:175 (-) Transcript_7672:109-633(-)